MENLLFFLQEHLPILFSHTYWFLFFGAAIEGLTTLVVGGFLVSTHSVDFIPAFIAFALGHTLSGYIWYTVGYFAGSKPLDRWGRSREQSRKVIESVEHYFHRYSGRAIFVTKFTLSLTIATMIMAGSLKYDLKRFSLYNFLGSTAWAFFAMSIGYFFGQSYKLLFDYARGFLYFVLFLIVAIFVVYRLKKTFTAMFVRVITLASRMQELGATIKDHLDRIIGPKDPR